MDPNSQNQRWSMWTFDVGIRGKDVRLVTMDELKINMAKFMTALFNSSAGRMDIAPRHGGITMRVLMEGSDITPTDPAYIAWVQNRALQFFIAKLGVGATVTVTGKLMAGSRQDGTPSDQMIIMPTIKLPDLLGDDQH